MLSGKFYQAVEVVCYVAINAGSGRVSSSNLTEHLQVNKRYLEPMLQQLVKANILKGTKGANGGYSLAKEQRKISIFEILQSVMQELKSTSKPCNFNLSKELKYSLEKLISEKTKQIFLSDLTKDNLQSQDSKTLDNFNI